MKEYVEVAQELSSDCRNYLSVAYKNVVGTRRNAWRVVSATEQKKSEAKQLASEYRKKIEGELDVICKEVIVSC